METQAIIRLGLVGFGVLGIAYACIGTGFFSNSETGWWDGLPKAKKQVFIAAIFASILQGFL